MSFNMEEACASLEAGSANGAQIVLTTLSSSDRKSFSHVSHGFHLIIIDEAVQANEVAVLPSISAGAAACF